MRINPDARLPQNDSLDSLKQRIVEINRDVAAQVNALSEGALQGATNAVAAVPTTGSYKQGDYVRNSAPVEAGTAGSKYVIEGWLCVTGPLTFVQKRFLTGN